MEFFTYHFRQSEEQIRPLIVVGEVHLAFSSPCAVQVLQTVDVALEHPSDAIYESEPWILVRLQDDVVVAEVSLSVETG